MKEYTKLFRIKYNNKLFDIFSDENHKKTFLEVKEKDNEIEYYYPELQDYIYLNNTYNKEPDGIVYNKKYKFTPIIILVGLSAILITGINVLDNASTNYKLKKETNNTKLVILDEEENIEYLEEISTVIVTDNRLLNNFGLQDVSFDEVRKTLDNNKNIPEKYRNYVIEFIDALEEGLPEIDLRVFNENLKTLEFDIINKNDWTTTGVDGLYNYNSNTISIKDSYYSEEREKEVVFHELGHTLNLGVIKIYDNEGKLEYKLIKKFCSTNGYGNSLSEGFNTVLTDYLLTENKDTFFDKEVHEYNGYQKISNLSFQMLKIMDNYSLYDYINGNINEFEIRLKESGVSISVDLLDALIKVSDEIEIVENQSLNKIEERILEKRIKQEINSGKSDLEIYKLINKIELCNDTKYDICSEVLNINTQKWLIRISNPTKINNSVSTYNSENNQIEIEKSFQFNPSQVNIYQENQIIATTKLNDLLIYSTINENEKVYNFGIIDYENETAYNVLTNQEINIEDIHESIQATTLFFSFYDYNIEINVDLLKSKELKEIMESYYGNDIETNEYAENQNLK